MGETEIITLFPIELGLLYVRMVRCKLLIKQGKHDLANESYSGFAKEYKQLYDETYELSFKQIIEE